MISLNKVNHNLLGYEEVHIDINSKQVSTFAFEVRAEIHCDDKENITDLLIDNDADISIIRLIIKGVSFGKKSEDIFQIMKFKF